MATHVEKNWKVALKVLKYLKETQKLQLKFTGSNSPKLNAYYDSDWDVGWTIQGDLLHSTTYFLVNV